MESQFDEKGKKFKLGEERTTIIKEEKRKGFAWVQQYKDTPLSIIKDEGTEEYTVALGENIITERRFEGIEETKAWLDNPTEDGKRFPWKEIIVIGIITKKAEK